MKFNRDSKLTTTSIYIFLVIIASIIFYYVLYHLESIFTTIGIMIGYIQPVIYGIIIAFLLNPVMRKIEDKLVPKLFKNVKASKRRVTSLILTFVIFFLVCFLFIWIILPQLLSSIANVAKQMPTYVNYIQNFYEDIIDRLYRLENSPQSNQQIQQLSNKVLEALKDILNSIGAFLISFISSILQASANFFANIVQVVMGFIISIYILLTREKLFAQIKKTAYAFLPKKAVKILEDILLVVVKIFKNYVIGAIFDSIIVGGICFSFLIVAGFFSHGWWQYAAFIGVIMGLTNIIPFFGPYIGAVPSLLLLLTINPMYALIFLIFVFVLEQVNDNIISPNIAGSSTGLSTLWVLFAIMLFGGLFGIVGMFIAVPLFAVIYALFKQFVNYLLEKKNLSQNTKDYDSSINPIN